MTTPDFSKIWAASTPLTPYVFDDADYLDGWEFLGEIPPDRRMFDAWQNQADTKMQWLYQNTAYLLRQNNTTYAVGDIAFSAALKPCSRLHNGRNYGGDGAGYERRRNRRHGYGRDGSMDVYAARYFVP